MSFLNCCVLCSPCARSCRLPHVWGQHCSWHWCPSRCDERAHLRQQHPQRTRAMASPRGSPSKARRMPLAARLSLRTGSKTGRLSWRSNAVEEPYHPVVAMAAIVCVAFHDSEFNLAQFSRHPGRAVGKRGIHGCVFAPPRLHVDMGLDFGLGFNRSQLGAPMLSSTGFTQACPSCCSTCSRKAQSSVTGFCFGFCRAHVPGCCRGCRGEDRAQGWCRFSCETGSECRGIRGDAQAGGPQSLRVQAAGMASMAWHGMASRSERVSAFCRLIALHLTVGTWLLLAACALQLS